MMATSLPVFESFPIHQNEQSSGLQWRKWIAKFENLLCGLDIKSDARKKALLLHYGGDGIFDIFNSMTDEQKGVGATTENGEANEYDVLKESLSNHFTPKKNTAYETFKFRQMKQTDETIDSFVTRLRTQATFCDFKENDREILAQIIQGCSSMRLRRKALKDDLSLDDVLKEARAYELSDIRAAEIEAVTTKPNEISAVQYEKRSNGQQEGNFSSKSHFQRGNRSMRDQYRNHVTKSNPTSSDGLQNVHQCRYCGGMKPHFNSCPAKGKTCMRCRKIGHFARVCESSGRVRSLAETDQNTKSDEDEIHHIFRLGQYQKAVSPRVVAKIDGAPSEFVVDSGSTINLINFETFQTVQQARNQHISLQNPCPKMYAYAAVHPLPLIGYFTGNISVDGNQTYARIYVLDDVEAKNRNNILNSHTSEELGLLQFNVSSISTNPTSSRIPQNFPSLFDGSMGKIKGRMASFYIDMSV